MNIYYCCVDFLNDFYHLVPDQRNDITIERVEQNDTHTMVEGSKRLDACGDRVEDLQLTGMTYHAVLVANMKIQVIL